MPALWHCRTAAAAAAAAAAPHDVSKGFDLGGEYWPFALCFVGVKLGLVHVCARVLLAVRTEAVGDTLSSVVFAGAIVGQLFMGIAGDLCGRRKALILTNLFTALGALCSALCSWGSTTTVYTVITVSRFVLGVGVGGKYPLAGTVSSEGEAASESKAKSAIEIALGFFWQTPGTMLPYAIGMAYLAAKHLTDAVDIPFLDASLGFRLVLGIGALPALAVVILTWCQVCIRRMPELGAVTYIVVVLCYAHDGS